MKYEPSEPPEPPKPTPSPVYRPKGASRVGNHWEVFSGKLNRCVCLYSDLEYDHWLTVEWDRRVTTFCEQPCVSSTHVGGKLRTSVPDMWVRYDDGREEYLEVKYEKDAKNPGARTAEQLYIQSEWALSNRYSYRIVTERVIRGNRIKLRNLSRMTHALRVLDKQTIETQTKIIQPDYLHYLQISGKSGTLGDLLNSTKAQATTDVKLAIVFNCISAGLISAPIEAEAIAWSTKVFLV